MRVQSQRTDSLERMLCLVSDIFTIHGVDCEVGGRERWP